MWDRASSGSGQRHVTGCCRNDNHISGYVEGGVQCSLNFAMNDSRSMYLLNSVNDVLRCSSVIVLTN
jgi:hypothetical protein